MDFHWTSTSQDPRHSFRRIRGQENILAALRTCMYAGDKHGLPFLAGVFSRQHRPGGIIYTMVRPTGLSTLLGPTGETACSVTLVFYNSVRPVAHLEVSKIEYVEIL